MSNKSKSRKRKHYTKLGKVILLAVSVMCEVINIMKKEREKKYPKFASAGTTLHSKPYELQGGEIIAPYTNRKIYLEDNTQYMFQNNKQL